MSKSNAFAVAAMIATTMIGVMALTSPAEARRYKQKVMRHQMAAVMPPASQAYFGYSNPFVQTSAAPSRRVYRVGRKARGYAARSPRMSRAAYRHTVRMQRVSRASRVEVSRASRVAVSRASRVAVFRARRSASVAVQRNTGFGSTGFGSGFGSSALVAQARRYVGTNPTGMRALWCARFMNMVLEKSGKRGTGSNMARSFASYGRRVSGPQVGAIAVMSRGRRGGHVGIVSGIDAKGNPIVISGNYNRRVGEAAYPRGRVYAYVMP